MRRIFFYVAIAVTALASLLTWSCNNTTDKTTPKDSATASLARGAYLVNVVCNCMHCHADRDFTKFAGPIVAGTEGKGGEEMSKGVYVRNITPSVLKNWTDDEIARAITLGITKDGDTLFPTMPYREYIKMPKEDIYSIVAYLRTLKPIPDSVPKRDVANYGGFITGTYTNMVVKHLGEKMPLPAEDDHVKMGAYLVNAGNCSGCHTPFDRQKMDFRMTTMYLSGGSVFNETKLNFKVASANLTPDTATGIGAWTEDIFLAKFKAYRDAKTYSYAPGKYNSIMPWTILCNLKEEDLKDIYAYLRTVKPVSNKVEKWPQ